MKRLLTEKYRPINISDLILDIELQNILLNMIKLNKIPNIILYGPPGTGKTSTALCIAHTIMEKKYYEECILEINASDNRCLEDIENIITFCKKKTNSKKIVILDEADILTKKSLKIIENLLDMDIIFIFTCNSKKSIIESIQSRSTILLFNKISDNLIINKLKYICKLEGHEEKNIDVNTIAILSNGDFRKAINLLELNINDNNINKFNI
jgi:DNA polymerase III delta prime subunit